MKILFTGEAHSLDSGSFVSWQLKDILSRQFSVSRLKNTLT